MFTLDAFDAHLRQQSVSLDFQDDRILAQELRGTPAGRTKVPAIGVNAAAGGVVVALAAYGLPSLFAGTQAEAMTVYGMDMQGFADHMKMSVKDPILQAMFEDLCMALAVGMQTIS